MIPKRYFQEDVELSIIGLGGFVMVGHEQDAANAIVAEAIERGVNYFDVAPTYCDGEAEIKLGEALRPYRDEIFLACKTHRRDAAAAQADLDQSFQHLQTDHFDLYQFHAVTTLAEVEQIFAPGGAIETFERARAQGQVRFLGFSAHSVEAALAMLDRYHFDSVLFPINYVCYEQGNFGPQVVQKAKEIGTARLAIKAMARTKWPEGETWRYPYCWYEPIEERELARQSLRFALSEDITAAIPPADAGLFRMALEFADDLTPLSEEERRELLESTAGLEPILSAS